MSVNSVQGYNYNSYVNQAQDRVTNPQKNNQPEFKGSEVPNKKSKLLKGLMWTSLAALAATGIYLATKGKVKPNPKYKTGDILKSEDLTKYFEESGLMGKLNEGKIEKFTVAKLDEKLLDTFKGCSMFRDAKIGDICIASTKNGGKDVIAHPEILRFNKLDEGLEQLFKKHDNVWTIVK